MLTKLVLKVSLSGKDRESLDFLSKEMWIDNYQDVVRALIRNESDKRRSKRFMYGAGETVPRETRAEKMRRISQMVPDELNEYLGPLLKEEFVKGQNDTALVFLDPLSGAQMVHIKSPATGMEDKVPLDGYLRRWDKEKRLP